MDSEDDPFDKAKILLDSLIKVKKKEEREQMVPIIVDILQHSKQIGKVISITSEQDESRVLDIVSSGKNAIIASSSLLKLAGKLKIDPRLKRTRTFVIVRVLGQMLKDDVITVKTTRRVTKKGNAVIVKELELKE